MKHSRTAEEIGDRNITRAAHPQKEGPALHFDVDALSVAAPVRDVPLPEPVDVAWVNGRPPGGWQTAWEFCRLPWPGGGWEEDAIRAGRERDRRAGMVLLAGTTTDDHEAREQRRRAVTLLEASDRMNRRLADATAAGLSVREAVAAWTRKQP